MLSALFSVFLLSVELKKKKKKKSKPKQISSKTPFYSDRKKNIKITCKIACESRLYKEGYFKSNLQHFKLISFI